MIRGLQRGSATLYHAALWDDCSLLFRGRQAHLGQPVLIVMFQFHCVPAQPLAELRAFLARDHGRACSRPALVSVCGVAPLVEAN